MSCDLVSRPVRLPFSVLPAARLTNGNEVLPIEKHLSHWHRSERRAWGRSHGQQPTASGRNPPGGRLAARRATECGSQSQRNWIRTAPRLVIDLKPGGLHAAPIRGRTLAPAGVECFYAPKETRTVSRTHPTCTISAGLLRRLSVLLLRESFVRQSAESNQLRCDLT
jgi:hypothetical protein